MIMVKTMTIAKTMIQVQTMTMVKTMTIVKTIIKVDTKMRRESSANCSQKSSKIVVNPIQGNLLPSPQLTF